MKKLFAVILALAVILAAVPASALTVTEFVERYNAATGHGFNLEMNDYFIMDNNTWVLDTDQDCLVGVFYDPLSSFDSASYKVTGVVVARSTKASVGTFMNAIGAALEAVYPDEPETVRLYSVVMAMRAGDSVWGMGQRWTRPVAFNTEHMGQFVYQEKSDRFMFMFDVVEE